MREAGDRTTWTDPDATYEAAVHAAVDAAFDDAEVRAVLDDLVGRVAGPGWSNAVSAKLVALTMPGVPTSTRAASCGSRAWSTPTTGDRSTSTRDATVLGRVLGGERPVLTPSVDDRGHAKLLVTQAALTAAPRPAAPVHDVRARAGRAARRPATCSPSTAAARSRVATRLPGRPRPRAAGATPCCTCPTGRWADLLTGR